MHRGQKLFQQYLVDAYVRTEGARLQWLRCNQKQLRVEQYKGLMDYIHQPELAENYDVGKAVILPSTFTGSPRNMQQNYQDAMAIVRKFGKPDVFLTMTCNPRWTDIVTQLSGQERSEYRPDIVARVFKLKLKHLLRDITVHHILGAVVAHVHVVEFQKRGLPHAHLLIILRPEDKVRTPDDIDRFVSAELPDPHINPKLFKMVTTHMVHGPCGFLNPLSPCMVDGKCSTNYPKKFSAQTSEDVDGFSSYRRRDTGILTAVGNKQIDNRWIVPYNPYLLLKYNCHINVELCASVKSVKYLYKYIYKGHDCATVEFDAITNNVNGATSTVTEGSKSSEKKHDEIKSFLNTRYVSAPEAVWRLLEFQLHNQSHTVYR